MKTNGKRLLSMLLALVLMFTMMPVSSMVAYADDIGEGSDSGGSDGEIKKGIPGFQWLHRGERFIRLTVVQLTAGAENWAAPDAVVVLGSKDYSDSDAYLGLASSVKIWWKSNALSAANYSKQGKTWAGYFNTVKRDPGDTYTMTDFTAEFGVPLPDVSGDSSHVIIGGTENRFQKMFVDEKPDGSTEANALFNAVLRHITNGRVDYNFFKESDCRLIIEPGGLTKINSNVAAMTLRDLIAYDTNGPSDYAENVRITWYGPSIRMLAYGLFTTRDEIGGKDADGHWQVYGEPAVQKVDKDTDLSDSYTYPHFKGAVPTQGYGLSIVTPEDVGADSKLDSYVGRVNIYIPTKAELTASGTTGDYGVETYSYVGKKGGLTEKPR